MNLLFSLSLLCQSYFNKGLNVETTRRVSCRWEGWKRAVWMGLSFKIIVGISLLHNAKHKSWGWKSIIGALVSIYIIAVELKFPRKSNENEFAAYLLIILKYLDFSTDAPNHGYGFISCASVLIWILGKCITVWHLSRPTMMSELSLRMHQRRVAYLCKSYE